jgi:hypothetical protein
MIKLYQRLYQANAAPPLKKSKPQTFKTAAFSAAVLLYTKAHANI